MRRLLLMALVAMLLLVLQVLKSSDLAAQQSPIYGDLTPTPEFQTAQSLVIAGALDDAIAKFSMIADANPHTTLGAVSLFNVAFYSADPTRVYQRILHDYPQSRFEIRAKQALLGLKISPTNAGPWVDATDKLAQAYGAPTLAKIVEHDADRHELTERVHALPSEIQHGLNGIYHDLFDGLEALKRYRDAFALAVFFRETFFNLHTREGISADALRTEASYLRFGELTLYQFTVTDPVVQITRPKMTDSGRRPVIQIKTTAGDYRHSQVDLDNVAVLLDGADVSSQMTVHSEVDTSMSTDKPFERLTMTFRPAQALAKGTHSLTVVIPTESYSQPGPGQATTSLRFEVTRDDDGPDENHGQD